MSIVKMKRLQLIAMSADRTALFEELMRLGTVEITDAPERLKDREWADVAGLDQSAASLIKTQAAEINAAIDALDKYVPEKKSFFAPRPIVQFEEIFDNQAVPAALKSSSEINELARNILHTHTEENRINNRRASLLPWVKLDVPLNITSSREVDIITGVCPTTSSVEAMTEFLAAEVPMSELFLVNSDKEQHYLLFVCHKSEHDAAMDELKRSGFSRMVFKDMEGTAAECIKAAEDEIEVILSERESLKQQITGYSELRETLMCCADRIDQTIAKETARESLIATKEAFFLEGWTPAPTTDKLEALFEKYDCWYVFSEPEEGVDPPVKILSSTFMEPFGLVTEMYGTPKYTHVDPNPLIAPFFAVFFGMMYGDVAYGLVLLVLGIYMTKRVKPRGVIGQIFRLFIICGTSAMFFGFICGSVFGDGITSIAKAFFGAPADYEFKAGIFGMFDVMENPLVSLGIALGLGAIHIMTGMTIHVILLCRAGRPLDALMDVGSWWLLFAGIAIMAMGNGWTVLYCGIAALVLTQGRHSKSIAGKIFGGVASLYKITNYFSDILSYSRIMALAMATSVIAMVFNLMATLASSPPIIGVLIYAVVFAIGHAFNMGINIIGTFVHTARLQYLEYYNRFYVGGGTPFRPFMVKTRFVDINIKEEK